jgi:hypothetical protein
VLRDCSYATVRCTDARTDVTIRRTMLMIDMVIMISGRVIPAASCTRLDADRHR